MTRTNPRLRAAILETLQDDWTTVRDLAAKLNLWCKETVQSELLLLANEGIVSKRIDQRQTNQCIALYCKPEAALADPA